jgi:hypothetical protein
MRAEARIGDAGVSPGHPVHSRGRERVALQRVARTYGDRRVFRVDADDVERDAGCDAEPLPLANREPMDPLVPAEDVSLAIADGPSRHFRALPHELRVLARGHEADLLAVLLFRDPEPEAARLLAYGRLVQHPDGEAGPRQLRLREGEEDTTGPSGCRSLFFRR